MKNLQGALILLACLFAFAAVVFFFKYNELRSQAKLLETNNLASQGEAIGAKIEADQKSGEASGMERLAAENAKKAKEAQEMLARFKAGSEEEKQKLLEALNAQLSREADARLAAEKANAELAAQRDALEKAVAETRAALEELENKKSAPGKKAELSADDKRKVSKMQEDLKAREAQIEEMRKRAETLEAQRAAAESRQIVIEREIEKHGGKLAMPRYKRITTPALAN